MRLDAAHLARLFALPPGVRFFDARVERQAHSPDEPPLVWFYLEGDGSAAVVSDLLERAGVPPTEPQTCAHGDHEWPPPPGDGPWITGEGVWHRYVDGRGWVHDEQVPQGAVLDLHTLGPAGEAP